VVASVTAVAANVGLNAWLHPHYGYRVLALGTALSALVNCAILYGAFHRRIAPIPHGVLLRYLLRIAVAAAVMGAATWGTWYGIDQLLGRAGFWVRLVEALVPVAVGAGVYAAACAALRVEELEQFTARLRRRLRR
jgi:putative peptidoglycan lipid II flippase